MYAGDEVYDDEVTSGLNESTMIANRISSKQRGLEQEHDDTRGDHYGVVQTDCPLCFPVAMTEMQREDLRDEIEMDLL